MITALRASLANPVRRASGEAPAEPQAADLRGGSVGAGEVNRAQMLQVAAADGPAPGAPGVDAVWTDANKDGLGTSRSSGSKVWFTVADGRLTEVFYPTIDQANSRSLKFIVSDGESFAVVDHEVGENKVEVLDDGALAFRYVTEDSEHGFRLTRSYITDPSRNTVLVDVDFESTRGKPLSVYAVHDPADKNRGLHDFARVQDAGLVSQDGDVAQALVSSVGFEEASVGFKGWSDGVKELLSTFHLPHRYGSADDGNVVEAARVITGPQGHFTLALGFGPKPEEALAQARGSLEEGYPKVYDRYVGEWHDYLASLNKLPVMTEDHEKLLKMSAMVLASLEDKSHPGAMIASLSVPWGSGVNANESHAGGYHLVWPRDLYQVATAMLTLGDRATANRALDFLLATQYRADSPTPRMTDGSPNPWLSQPAGAQAQNRWVDGRPYWERLQMDQVAFPIVLAHELDRTDADTYAKHIKPAADFIARVGPTSQQERWEEQSGLSPSTMAAEIAGLVCAARIAEKNGDQESATRWLQKADDWHANLENWLVTRRGSHGDGQYYVRVNPNQDPNDAQVIDLKNGGAVLPEHEIIDPGFLELVRLGLKAGDDPIIRKSLKVVDEVLRVETPRGPGFYRYNGDGYGEKPNGMAFFDPRGGESGVGRLWPLLNGERALAEVAAGNPGEALRMVNAMVGFANRGRQLPEQVWDRPTVPEDQMNAGRAAWILRDNLDALDQAAGIGAKDGKFGVEDLKVVAGDEKRDPRLRAAARYLLDSKTVLTEFDMHEGKGPAVEIGWNDLNRAIDRHQIDFAPSKLRFGEGTNSATALAWSHAEFILACAALSTGQIPGCPAPVALRYLASH